MNHQCSRKPFKTSNTQNSEALGCEAVDADRHIAQGAGVLAQVQKLLHKQLSCCCYLIES